MFYHRGESYHCSNILSELSDKQLVSMPSGTFKFSGTDSLDDIIVRHDVDYESHSTIYFNEPEDVSYICDTTMNRTYPGEHVIIDGKTYVCTTKNIVVYIRGDKNYATSFAENNGMKLVGKLFLMEVI